MGGPLVVRTVAALPERFGAGGSFHGGGLVTDQPTSPHLLASKIKARMYFGIASNDDMRQPDAKDKLKEAFGQKAEIEVYSKSLHGWCVADMPAQPGMPIYNKPDAEKAWTKLVGGMLFDTAAIPLCRKGLGRDGASTNARMIITSIPRTFPRVNVVCRALPRLTPR